MKIQVTQEDIEAGVRKDTERCPINRALEIVSDRPCWTYGSWAIIGDSNYFLPDVACRFAERFDSGLAVEPFEFDLPITQ